MQVLRDKIEGFAGEDEAARRLRGLWSKAWSRTTFQVMMRFARCDVIRRGAMWWLGSTVNRKDGKNRVPTLFGSMPLLEVEKGFSIVANASPRLPLITRLYPPLFVASRTTGKLYSTPA